MNLKRPLFSMILEENRSVPSPASLVWIGITSLRNWKDFPKKTLMAYENVLNEALPKPFEKIYGEALKISDPVDQINFVTASLADRLRYVGDWRPVRGAYHPQTLAHISESGFGDCKNMSVAVGAILRKLGFETRVACTGRGQDWLALHLKIPVLWLNHALLYLKKGSQEFWIDPTNKNGFAQGIFADVADRQALILTPEGIVESQIPAMSAQKNHLVTELWLKLDQSQLMKGSGTLTLGGFSAETMTGSLLSKSKESLDFILLKWATDLSDLKSWKFQDYDLRSRIVSDFSTQFEFQAGWHKITTTSGPGILILELPAIQMFNQSTQDRVGDLVLVDPYEHKRTVHVSRNSLAAVKESTCSDDSKWFRFRRDVRKEIDTNQFDQVVFHDELLVKTRMISIEDLKTKEFDQAHQKLLNCLGDAVAIF